MNKLILLTIVLILVVLLVVYVNAKKTNFLFSPPPQTSAPTTTSSTPPNTHIVPLRIKKQKLVTGPSLLQAGYNQIVVLQITSDEDDEFSLLGYNKHVFLQKGKMVVLSFLATLIGNFSYQLERTKTVLGSIQIRK